MCTPTVTFSDTPGKTEARECQLEAQAERSLPIDGWPGEASKPARKRHARAARKAAASASVRASSLSGFLAHSNILDRALLKAPAFDRRKEPRHASIVLTEAERNNVRHLARQAANCGTLWMGFRGYDTSGPVDRERRLVCQARCGTRGCEDCARRIRERECGRVAGPWKLFFTLTVPRGRCSAADAWREAHGWIETLLRELRREVAWSLDTKPRAPGHWHDRHVDRWITANANIQAGEKLEYAWVLEPHQDGYPHVHLVVSASWVRWQFIKQLWERACGALGAWVYGERVYEIDGTCRYLSKYIAKSVLTAEILGMLFGRRLWATSLPKGDTPEPMWIREDDAKTSDLIDDCDSGDDWNPDEGWRLVCGKAGAYGIWERDLEQPSFPRIIAPDEGNDDRWDSEQIELVRGPELDIRSMAISYIKEIPVRIKWRTVINCVCLTGFDKVGYNRQLPILQTSQTGET